MNIVLGPHPWVAEAYTTLAEECGGPWKWEQSPKDLAQALAYDSARHRLFFLHWPWKVPTTILERHECVGFHMTDLPYGRGGTPLQNLILRGHTQTMLTAFRMTDELDAGPVYAKAGPILLTGPASAIYPRVMQWAVGMIRGWFRDGFPVPVPQGGEPVIFHRRSPGASRIHREAEMTLHQLYDHIRMTDADGYPRAHLRHGGFRLEIRDAVDLDDAIAAQVIITKGGA